MSRIVTAFCMILMSASALAQCPPGTVARGVYTKVCYPVATGPNSSSSGYGGAGAQLGQQIGTAAGELIRGALFGNPQQDAERRAAMEAQRQWEEQERQRLAGERARQDEERYQRLRTSLLDFNPGPQLSLMGTQPSDGLQLMLGDAGERSTSPALAELTRAAAWSTLAADAATPEDAAMFADAAFQSAIGAEVSLPPPPPDVRGVPVGPLVKDFEPLKKEYLGIRKDLPDAVKPVLDAEYRRELAAHAEEEAQAAERAAKSAAQKAQAREAIEEARRLRRQAEADLLLARSQMNQSQARANGVEQGLRDILASMAGPGKRGTGPKDSAYYKGFQDGSLCFSQSAGNFCRQAAAGDVENCAGSYRLGYSAGEKIKAQVLQDARDRGMRDKLAGRNYADTDPRAQGPCRYEYVMAYNRGYFSTRVGLLATVQTTSRTDVPASEIVARGVDAEEKRVIAGITSYANRMGWTAKEQARLHTALNELRMVGAGDYQDDSIRESWRNILARTSDGTFTRDATRGEGPGLHGTGQQSREDCAIFALATATGQPYGVVAAHATTIIRQGEWRDARDRSNPQGVFGKERGGLMGGEVVLLAEAFGQAEVVKPTGFAQVLKGGRPVMVNVVPRSGDTSSGHQVVLAKTFQRGGETWYEVIDSSTGPMRRLYVSGRELDFLIRENGIAYRPEDKRTPALLRAR